MTRLTFGIPVYNGERYLPSALASLQRQELEDIRIVISDNGSTDGTQEFCRAAAAEDDRIDYYRYEENRGGIWNYQNVLDQCKTELFSWMASDDIRLPAFAGATIAAMDAGGPEIVFANSRTRIMNGEGIIYEDLNDLHLGMDAATPHERVSNMLRAQAMHTMYGVIRTDALRRTRGMKSALNPDTVLVVELLCIGKMALAPDQLYLLRRHDSQVSVHASAASSWFPRGRNGLRSFAETRTNIELYRGVAHMGLPFAERMRTWWTLGPSWVFPRWHVIARDVANFIGIKPDNGRLEGQQRAQAAAVAAKVEAARRAGSDPQ